MDATPLEVTESRLERLTRLRTSHELLLSGEVPAREFASLSREYRAVLAEIESLAPVEKRGDVVDEIAQRRAARRAGPGQGASRSRRSV